MGLFNELRRRNVFKVGTAYLVLAWIVLQVVDVAVPALHLPEWVNSMVFLFGAIGFPFALFFAWAFELTPEGLKKESDIDREVSVTPQTGRQIDFVIIGLLAIALVYFIWKSNSELASPKQLVEEITESIEKPNQSTKTNATPVSDASIAVLPFVDMSQNQDQEYFADGISEEILNVLAKVKNLKVTSRSSSFSFKGEQINIVEVAKTLGVRHILEGSIRKSGSTIRITAQLIDADSDQHLWSQTYDRELVDIFKIQDEISVSIVNQLKDKLDLNTTITPRDMSNVSPDAHNEYLKGRFFIEKRNEADIEKALIHFTKATELSPEYAPAWMGVAWANLYLFDYGNRLPQVTYKLAKPAAEKALALDPELPEAYAVLSNIIEMNAEFIKSQHYLERSIELNPNYADAYSWLADRPNWLPNWIVDHHPEEGVNYAKIALSLDPLSMLANTNYAENLIALGRYQQAHKIVETMMEINSNYALSYDLLSGLESSQGYYGQSLNNLDIAISHSPGHGQLKSDAATILNRLGLNQKALALLDDGDNSNEYFALTRFWYSGEINSYIKKVRQDYPNSNNVFFGSYLRGNAETLAEDYPAAIDYYLKSNFCDLCDALIYCYQQIGETQTANKLLAERKKRFDKLLNAGVKNWIYHPTNYSGKAPITLVGMNNSYFSGDLDSAITQYQQAISDGYIIEQKYKIHPMYAKLRAHPQWGSLLAESNRHADKERKIYLALSKTDKNN